MHALHCPLYTIHCSLHTFTESNELQTVKYNHFYKTRYNAQYTLTVYIPHMNSSLLRCQNQFCPNECNNSKCPKGDLSCLKSSKIFKKKKQTKNNEISIKYFFSPSSLFVADLCNVSHLECDGHHFETQLPIYMLSKISTYF